MSNLIKISPMEASRSMR